MLEDKRAPDCEIGMKSYLRYIVNVRMLQFQMVNRVQLTTQYNRVKAITRPALSTTL